MKHLDTLKWPDFSGFDSFDSKWNPTLERASNTLKKLAQIIIDNNWTLDEPMIVWLHGKPWLWKSHLMDAFLKAIQGVKWSKITKPNNTQFFFNSGSNYKDSNIILTDDLFQRAASLNEVFQVRNWDKWWYPAQSLPDFLFDLYDGKKIWIVSSNFDIKDILGNVAQLDWQWRLASRIEHLLASTWVLHLEWDDHRKVLAQTGTRFSKLFD